MTSAAVRSGDRLAIVLEVVAVFIAIAVSVLVFAVRRIVIRKVRAVTSEIVPATAAIASIGEQLRVLVASTTETAGSRPPKANASMPT